MARVLIVDDEKSIRLTLSAFLKEAGHEAHAAEDADGAQALLKQQPFDVVISDIILPRVSGVELLRIIRKDAPDAQVIMMTGEPTVETAVATVREGANDYLTKPIGKQVILHAVERAAKMKALLDDRRRLAEANQQYQQQLEELVAKRTEALRASEQRYRLLIENSEDAILFTAPDGRIFSANPAACRMFQRTEAEICRLGRDGLVDATDPRLPVALEERHRTGRFHGELTFRRSDGQTFPGEASSVVFDAGEGELRTSMIIHDVSERKRVEDQLRLLSVAVEQSAVSVVITAPSGAIEYVNAKFTETTGYTFEEVRGLNPRFLKSGEIPAEEYRQLWQTIAAGREWRGEFHNRKKNGDLYWEAASISPIMDAAGKITHYLAVKEDITERKAVDTALKESEERFRALVGNIPTGVLVQTEGRIAFINEYALQVFGAGSPDEVIGRSIFERIHPDSREMVRQRMQVVNKEHNTVPLIEERYLRLDGAVIEVEVCAVPFVFDGKSGALVIFRDIGDRKRLEAQFREAQKMEGIGQLAGGVAHDFNNILTAIVLRLDEMKQQPGLDAVTREGLLEIETSANRAANLTRQLLLFGRRSVMTKQRLDVNEVVDNLLKMLRRLIGEDIKLRFHADTGLPGVEADVGMLEQVIVNLAVNARDAMPKGGCLTLSTELAEVSPGQAAALPEARPGRFVCLSIADTGCGMTQATLGRIFEPFFTTKEIGKGTGLGLATAYGIVSQHGGWISVETEVQKGSTFHIFLPATAETAAVAEPAAGDKPVQGGPETILVVEDDPGVRLMLGTFLRRWGYHVHEAGNGVEALALWRERIQEVDLLFTDMVMPEGMTGLDLARELRREKPDLKVIVSSGYSAELTELAGRADLEVTYVPKPCVPAKLAAAIRECLDELPERSRR